MTIVVLLILAALWAAVLLPPLLRGRLGRSGASLSDFTHRIAAIGKTGGWNQRPASPSALGPVAYRPSASPLGSTRPMTPVQRRRRDVLAVLAVAVGASLLLALVGRAPIFWALFVVALAALGGYVAMLRRIVVARRVDRALPRIAPPVVPVSNVRYLPKPVPPSIELRRTASR